MLLLNCLFKYTLNQKVHVSIKYTLFLIQGRPIESHCYGKRLLHHTAMAKGCSITLLWQKGCTYLNDGVYCHCRGVF